MVPGPLRRSEVGGRVMGRPTKLDDIIRKKIGDALAAGNTRTTAARLAGIHPETLREWARKGDEGDARFSAFSAMLRTKEALAEAESLKIIRDAARAGTWQAAAWFLERRAPAEWGRGSERVPEQADDPGASLEPKQRRAMMLSMIGGMCSGDAEFAGQVTATLSKWREDR